MAPAQVLQNEVESTTVKKQKMLLAGKERLAAYRREKALEKERKAAASRQPQDTSDNQSSKTAQGVVVDPGEVGPSSKGNGFTDDSLKAISSGSEAVHPVGINDHVSYNGAQYSPPPTVKENGSYVQLHTAVQETKINGAWSHKPKTDYEVAEIKKGAPEEYAISDGRQRQHIISEPIFQNSASREKVTNHSGTVAGAREAYFQGVPSIALSYDYDWRGGKSKDLDFTPAAEACLPIINTVLDKIKNQDNPLEMFPQYQYT